MCPGCALACFRLWLCHCYTCINCLNHTYSTELRSVLGISWVLSQMFFKHSNHHWQPEALSDLERLLCEEFGSLQENRLTTTLALATPLDSSVVVQQLPIQHLNTVTQVLNPHSQPALPLQL